MSKIEIEIEDLEINFGGESGMSVISGNAYYRIPLYLADVSNEAGEGQYVCRAVTDKLRDIVYDLDHKPDIYVEFSGTGECVLVTSAYMEGDVLTLGFERQIGERTGDGIYCEIIYTPGASDFTYGQSDSMYEEIMGEIKPEIDEALTNIDEAIKRSDHAAGAAIAAASMADSAAGSANAAAENADEKAVRAAEAAAGAARAAMSAEMAASNADLAANAANTAAADADEAAVNADEAAKEARFAATAAEDVVRISPRAFTFTYNESGTFDEANIALFGELKEYTGAVACYIRRSALTLPANFRIMGSILTLWSDVIGENTFYVVRISDAGCTYETKQKYDNSVDETSDNAPSGKAVAAYVENQVGVSGGVIYDAVSKAKEATEAANEAAMYAGEAAETANSKAQLAHTMAGEAANAMVKAERAASEAEDAATAANKAADAANKAAEDAATIITRYGVRFEGGANSGATVHRLYNAVGLVAGVGTDTETAVNDFDGIYPWSARRRCCGYWNDEGNFVVNTYKGEPGYAVDGSNGEVWVEHSLFFYKHEYTEDGGEEIVISATQLPGYQPAPIFLSSDGTLYQKAYTAAYPMATVDGKATSRSGVFSDHYSLNTAVSAARMLGENYTVTRMSEWYTECLYMWVEFATRDLQSIMMGAVNMPYSANEVAVIAEEGVNRIIVSTATAAKFVVGQTIGIGTSRGTPGIANNRIVTAIEDYDANNKAICFDGDPVNIAVGNVVFTLAWINGSCDSVLSSSGSPVSNRKGSYDCIYRGKERPYGCTFDLISDILFERNDEGTEAEPYTYATYFLPDTTKYANGAITDDYIRLNFKVPLSSGYAKTLARDDRFPWVRITGGIGGSNTTWYSDLFYPPSAATSVASFGGHWYTSRGCGMTYWYCPNSAISAEIYNAGRLSYCRRAIQNKSEEVVS